MNSFEPLKEYNLYIDDKIKDLKSEEVDIVIFSSLSSNVYMLNIFVTLSKVLKLLSEKGKIKSTIKIKLLIPYDLTNELDILMDPLKDHYGTIITIKGNMMQSIIQIRSFEFKSLVNSIIRGLNNLETKDIVLNDVEYHDILGYVIKNDIKVEPSFEQSIEQFRKENIDEWDPIKRVLFTASTKNNKEFHALGELLKIINHYENNKKKIVLIVSTKVKKWIEQFFKQQNTGFINFACYKEPLEVFEEPFSPFSYYTLVSPYINEHEHSDFIENLDELWFAGMLKDLDSSAFGSEIEYQYIIADGADFNTLIRSPTGKLLDDVRARYVKKDRKNHQKALIKAINLGFLTIQEDIISQLKLIL